MGNKFLVTFFSIFFSLGLWAVISLTNQYYTVIQVPVKVIDLPVGYTGVKLSSDYVSLKVRGNGRRLLELSLSSSNDYMVSAENDSGRRSIDIRNLLPINNWLTNGVEVFEITPRTLSFNVERKISKKVKIYPSYEAEYKPGFGLAKNIRIAPDSVTITGGVSIVRRIDSVYTKPVNLFNVDKRTIENVEFERISGVDFSFNNADVEFDIQRIVEKRVDDISVELQDVPAGKSVILIPNKIGVGLKGGIDIVGKVTNQEIKAFVSYNSIITDTLGSLQLNIALPPNVSLIYSDPERIKYIIKKFK